MPASLKLRIEVAQVLPDVVRCQNLIADVYSRRYGVQFSHARVDLEAKIEPFPHRYIMATIKGELVASAGLYLHDTYVERYGHIEDEEIAKILTAAGANGYYSPARKRETTKLVVKAGWGGHGIGRSLFAAMHSRDFLQMEATAPHLVLVCAKISVFLHLHDVIGVRTRLLKPFPEYKVHELYRSPGDPMESRLILPEEDVPRRWYDLRLPAEIDVQFAPSIPPPPNPA